MPGYLNDILGLLNLRENQGLGRDQLRQRAREFEQELGLTREQADRAAQQWQQQFQEAKTRRQFEEAQQREAIQRQQAQQNYANIWQQRPGEQDILRSLLSNAQLRRIERLPTVIPRQIGIG